MQISLSFSWSWNHTHQGHPNHSTVAELQAWPDCSNTAMPEGPNTKWHFTAYHLSEHMSLPNSCAHQCVFWMPAVTHDSVSGLPFCLKAQPSRCTVPRNQGTNHSELHTLPGTQPFPWNEMQLGSSRKPCRFSACTPAQGYWATQRQWCTNRQFSWHWMLLFKYINKMLIKGFKLFVD